MLLFSSLTDSGLQQILPLLSRYPSGACDLTPGGLFMWRAFFDTRYAFGKDALFFSLRYYDGSTRVMYPIGGDARRNLECLMQEFGTPLCFAALTAPQLAELMRLYPGRVRAKFERNICDYLYDPKTLSDMPGKHLAGQRGHIHYFQSHYEVRAEEITPENRSEAIAFYDANFTTGDVSPLACEERRRARELLENPLSLSLCTLLLRADGIPVALSIGEKCGDTLYVHVEKALRTYRGAHQCIVSAFAERYGEGMRFLNREEDDGAEGLRETKLALHPVALLKKYTAVLV